jgi:hypothetical protein
MRWNRIDNDGADAPWRIVNEGHLVAYLEPDLTFRAAFLCHIGQKPASGTCATGRSRQQRNGPERDFRGVWAAHFYGTGVFRQSGRSDDAQRVGFATSRKGSFVRPLSGKIGAQAGMPGRDPKRT